jgi:prepilin-type N-terminal cleavage/methylation domain-containing protein
MSSRLANKQGMTLVEMLVAIAMASILIVFFFQADIALRKSAYGWIKQASLEETAILLRQQLRMDLLLIDSVLQADNRALKFTNSLRQTTLYDFENHNIKRNGLAILPKTVQLQDIDLLYEVAGVGSLLRLTLKQGADRNCQITLPIRPWKVRTLKRSKI